ncbi:MAG: NAD(P)/FAD-dependent oxidoreductase [Sphingomonas sp.]|nr:NAD(P)/FAD-dependent oxidoreductase [Sphingomonas sp.]
MDDPYVAPGFTRDPVEDMVDAVILGGGFGGLMMGARLRQAGLERIRVIDKAGDFGGTWYWNRYPGAACDIESYVYFPLLEETGYIPKHKYSFGPEILEYSKLLGRHFGLYDDALFQTRVTRMTWDEEGAVWIVETDRGDRMKARHVVLSGGPLNEPKLPGIFGIDTFTGHTFHTSRWDYDYTGGDSAGGLDRLKDKRVGIIGTGATAIQCIPHLAEAAEHLYVFQRTPSSVDARNNRETDPDWVKSLQPGWQQRRMDNFIAIVHTGEQDEDLVNDGWTDIYQSITSIAVREKAEKRGRPIETREREMLMEYADAKKMEGLRARVDMLVEDPETADKLKPWYRLFCKRPCFNDYYYPAFNRDNVTLVDTGGRGVEGMTEHGVIADGREFEVDCLIFATGFEVGVKDSRRSGVEVVGRDGLRLADKWADGLKTLHGLQTNGFPNMFVMGFTQTAFTFLVPYSLDVQAKQIAWIISAARDRGKRIIETTPEGEEGWCEEMRAKARRGVKFYTECTPGYYNSEGDIYNPHGWYMAMYGAGPIAFQKVLKEWRDDGGLPGVELRE